MTKRTGKIAKPPRQPTADLFEADGATYKSRAAQCEGIAREVEHKQIDLREALRSAAFVGACEERDHALATIRREPSIGMGLQRRLEEAICGKSVLEVLGFPESPP